MILQVEIPKEFEQDFRNYRFNDCFQRCIADIRERLGRHNSGIAGNYEAETLEMLAAAFKKSKEVSVEISDPEQQTSVFQRALDQLHYDQAHPEEAAARREKRDAEYLSQAAAEEVPTAKQIVFARKLSRYFNEPLPETNTKKAYSDYISRLKARTDRER